AALLECLVGPPAEGVHFRVGMLLVDGNELGPKTEAHDGNANLLVTGHETIPLQATVTAVGSLCQIGTCGIACRLVLRTSKGKGAVHAFQREKQGRAADTVW